MSALLARLRALPGTVRRLVRDDLYRTTVLLLVNVAVLSGLGLVFWWLATWLVDPEELGVFAGWTAAANLLAAIAGLGLAQVVMRNLAASASPRVLASTAVVLVGSLGVLLGVLAMLVLGPIAPASLHLDQAGTERLAVLCLVAVSAAGGIIDAVLIASGSLRALIGKNVVGGISRFALMVPLADHGSAGLLVAYTIGAALALGLAWLGIRRALPAGERRWPQPSVLRPYLGLTLGNHAGAVAGILPMTLVPLIVLGVLGPADAGRFQVAFLLASVLGFVPSMTSQAYLAHAARTGAEGLRDAARALRAIYALLVPAVCAIALGAPLILLAFKPEYAETTTGALRLLALAALATAVTYVVDALLNVQRRGAAYAAMNALNAVLVVGAVALLAHRGLTAVGIGWLVGQALSAGAGLALVARRTARARVAGAAGAAR